MANFKFKKNPKNINLDSVITDEMPICCGGGEAYCEGKITVTYDDGIQEVFYLDVMSNLCAEWHDDEKKKKRKGASEDDRLARFYDDKFMYAISHRSIIPGDARDKVEDKTVFNYESMKKAFASPLGDILRKLTIEYAVFTNMIEEAGGK